MNQINMDGYERITKTAAKKLFSTGKTFYIQSCNFIPVNMWQSAMEIDPIRYQDESMSFDSMVNNFEYYNCGDNERGYYSSFYVK